MAQPTWFPIVSDDLLPRREKFSRDLFTRNRKAKLYDEISLNEPKSHLVASIRIEVQDPDPAFWIVDQQFRAKSCTNEK